MGHIPKWAHQLTTVLVGIYSSLVIGGLTLTMNERKYTLVPRSG